MFSSGFSSRSGDSFPTRFIYRNVPPPRKEGRKNFSRWGLGRNSREIFRRLIWGCLRNTTYPKSVRAWQIQRFEYCRGTRSLPAESPLLSSREIIASAQLLEIIEPLREILLAASTSRIFLVTFHSFALSSRMTIKWHDGNFFKINMKKREWEEDYEIINHGNVTEINVN